MIRRPPRSTLFPSPPLFRSRSAVRRCVVDLGIDASRSLLSALTAGPERSSAHRPHYGRHETRGQRSEEHTSELQSRQYLVCRLLLEKKKNQISIFVLQTKTS